MTERSMDRVERAPEEVRQEWLGMLEGLAEQIQEQRQEFQQMVQEVLSTYTQLLSIPITYAQEGVRGARFPIEGYDELTVEEVSGRLGGLSAEDLRVVRDHEERNKNRDTILEQLDRKIRASS